MTPPPNVKPVPRLSLGMIQEGQAVIDYLRGALNRIKRTISKQRYIDEA